jgi:subtilisin family serine protease
MKKLLSLCAVALIVHGCAQKEEQMAIPQYQAVSKKEMDAFIVDKGINNFRWSMATDDMLLSALQATDKVAAIGYRPTDESNVEDRLADINIADAKWRSAREKVLDIVFEEESKFNKSLTRSTMEVFGEEQVLPVVDVFIENPTTLKRLRASGLIRYIEPLAYQPTLDNGVDLRSGSGCGSYDGNTALSAPNDFTIITPNAKAPWNYSYHQITQAWAKSTGAGVKVMIIDSGVSPNQDNLGSQFNQGASSGRSVEKQVTLPKAWFWSSAETVNDDCGHGTAMSGLCLAPRGTDGNATGVAYNAGLVSVRASTDVFLSESREFKGVADAYTLLGNRADIKISSMSLGTIISSSQISDAIKFAYGKGKLMFCAAGTSFSWASGWVGVIFPATMPEVMAITGVKDSPTNAHCDECHKGSEVDFVVVMEKASNGLHMITTAMSGNVPTTVGGSSASTATTAGMAALIASKYPSLTRAQIVEKMRVNASLGNNKSSEYGWGRVNINAALSN